MLPDGIPALDRTAIADALTTLYVVLSLVARLRRAFAAPRAAPYREPALRLEEPLERIAAALERLADARTAQTAALQRLEREARAAQRSPPIVD